MARLALYPNDAGVTLLDDQRLLYREPGFALVDENGVTLGRAAFENSRIQPLGIQHRYWSALSTAPLADRRFEHLTTADLASQHLETLWRQAGNPSADVVVAVPSYMQGDSLGLLLGIAESLNIRCIAMIDAAVAATRREYVNAVPVHIEMGLHATTLTRLGQQGQAQVEKTEVLDDCGTLALYDAWLNAIAEAFVQQSRFDPLHTAETEQLLLDRLPGWLSEAATRESVRMTIQHASLEHGAELDALSLIAAAAPFYQQIASRLRTLYRAGEVPALQVTDRVARLPGLTDMLKARVGGEVFALEPGATARGALARVTESTATSSGIALRRQLPWDQTPFEVQPPREDLSVGGQPTHLLHRHTAHRIDERPLVLGSRALDGSRSLVLDTDMPGVSRRHCSLALVDGRCIVEDSSRYGTFLNGHRISGSTVLQVGDTLRIGSPGFELQLITTDTPNGA